MNPWKQERNRRILIKFKDLREKGKSVREAKDELSKEFFIGPDMLNKIIYDRKYREQVNFTPL